METATAEMKRVYTGSNGGGVPRAAATIEVCHGYVLGTEPVERRVELYQQGQMRWLSVTNGAFVPTSEVALGWRRFMAVQRKVGKYHPFEVEHPARELWIREPHYQQLAEMLDQYLDELGMAERIRKLIWADRS